MNVIAADPPRHAVASEWQRRRAELTHDWLQNRALAHVAALLAIVHGDVRADEVAIRALSAVISEWRERRDDVGWLADHVQTALSPLEAIADGAVFDSHLRALSEEAWKRRHEIDEVVASIRTIALDIDRMLAALTPMLRAPARSSLAAAAPSLLAFAAAARALLAAFRHLPPRAVI
jgi:hypothetical protein